jgi:tetratricopeptide (TPR) repeat protein
VACELDAGAHAQLSESLAEVAAALRARDRLVPLLDEVGDPYLHAVSQLAIAWASLILDDRDHALERALDALEQLRGQYEPFWTAVAAGTAGSLEMAANRDDAARSHLEEAHDLAERFDSAWPFAWAHAELGLLAVKQGRYDEARALLGQSLELSVAARSTPLVTVSLTGIAALALAEGHPERAAELAGAVDGLRARAGRRPWPMLRRQEAELVDRVRGALGSERFDQAYAAGFTLDERRAVALAREQRLPEAAAC